MSVLLQRGEGVETVTLEALSGVDAQGKPTYGSPIAIKGRVVREDALVKLGGGSEVQTVVTVWIDAAQTQPADQDHLTFADGLVGVVVEVLQRKRIDGTADHTRVRVKKE